MTHQTPLPGHAPGLPVARLLDVHDLLTLALDATEGSAPQFWQMPAARGYVRHALRQVNRLLPSVGAKQ